MILADKTIRRLCTMPTGMLTHRGETRMSHMTPEEIIRNNIEFPSGRFSMEWRGLTAEEQAAWKPMITPFVPKQVREHERNATPGENYLKGVYKTKEEFQAALPRNTVSVRNDVMLGLQIREKIISYGLSSYGYDVRLARKFKIFTNVRSSLIDPLDMQDACYTEVEGDYVIIPPNSYVLGHTIETFNIPREVTAICVGKSTYARCGAIVNVTPIEAGFEGTVVIEISNATNLPLKVYAGHGIAQFLFFVGDVPCEVSYGDRGGKYQGQTGIQNALV